MRTSLRLLIAFTTIFVMASASEGQTEGETSQNGLLVIRNGSEIATLSVTAYRLDDVRKSPVKEGAVPPTTSKIYSLPAGDYIATFNVTNGKASVADGHFSLKAGEDFTINFYPKEKR